MNVVDSSAWLSYFSGDANADIFSTPIENIDELMVPSITITEVFKNILRQRGEDMSLEVIAHMQKDKVIAPVIRDQSPLMGYVVYVPVLESMLLIDLVYKKWKMKIKGY